MRCPSVAEALSEVARRRFSVVYGAGAFGASCEGGWGGALCEVNGLGMKVVRGGFGCPVCFGSAVCLRRGAALLCMWGGRLVVMDAVKTRVAL